MTHSKVPTAEQPLAGVKILELSTMVTCSLASMTLVAQGAEVIKIEPPLGGDVMRHLGHQKNGISALFHNCNRGKRSLAIDLKSSAGVDAVTQLAMKADLVMHNYRPGVMDRMGLGSTSLRGINNRLTYIASLDSVIKDRCQEIQPMIMLFKQCQVSLIFKEMKKATSVL